MLKTVEEIRSLLILCFYSIKQTLSLGMECTRSVNPGLDLRDEPHPPRHALLLAQRSQSGIRHNLKMTFGARLVTDGPPPPPPIHGGV